MAMTRGHDQRFEIHPLGRAFGAEIHAIQLARDVDDALFEAIHAAFLEHQLLLFRDQDLPPADQVAFARRFGEVQIHAMNQYHTGDHPELYSLTNLDADGNPSGTHPDRGTLHWHTDNSWSKVTGQATMLYVEVAPEEGGGTGWADMYGAHDAMSAAERAELAPIRAVHDLNFSRTRRHGEDPMTDEQRRLKPPVDHPIVRTHGETGRKCIFLGDHASHILGRPLPEGREMVAALNRRIVEFDNIYHHTWRAGDFAVWDNRCLLHRADEYDARTQRRVIRRCTILGQVPE